MNFATVAVVGLALVAACLALPVDMGVGLDLKLGDADFWKKEITVGSQKIQLGMGWSNNGIVSAGAKLMLANVNGQQLPISAAVSSNLSDMKQLKYQVGTMMADKVSGIVYGDANGAVQYQVNARLPVQTEGSPVSAIGASLEGSGLKPTTLTGGISLGNEVIQAKVGFDDNMKPATFNFGLGADV